MTRPRYRICTKTSLYWYVEEFEHKTKRWVPATETTMIPTGSVIHYNEEAPVVRNSEAKCEEWIDRMLMSFDACKAYLDANPPREYP
jgi:hypothetical protein